VAYNQGEIAGEYTEMVGGRRCDWPMLAAAIARAKEVQGTLVIAKLDRLVRNAGFTARLNEAGVDFVCCDDQNVNRQTIHMFAAVADKEAKRISANMKVALSAAKERGVRLGSAREGHWEGREDRRREGIRKGQPMAAKAAAEARMIKALNAYAFLMPSIVKMRDEDRLTLAEIAKRINAEGHKTSAGLPFTPTMIIRLLKRAGALKPQPAAPPPEPPADFSDLPLFRLCHDSAGAGET
jgi:DNA invertase Pin-like site-specific DNA recombinase